MSSSHLNSLECLDLSNNNLSVVPTGLPRNLVLLHLEKNSIRSIPADALSSVRNLEYLLLHNNNLRSRFIHPSAFQVNLTRHSGGGGGMPIARPGSPPPLGFSPFPPRA